MSSRISANAATRVPVLIVGGGPIGLALAADLGRRGVRARLVERGEDRVGSAKMIVVSVRTMEFCRQLGIAPDVRDWGFPKDQSLDSVFCTTLKGYELGRVHEPPLSVNFTSPHSPERERPCPQTWFDPILQKHARKFSNIELSYRTELVDFEQDETGVYARLQGPDGPELVVADYMVGCDGYSSTVRDKLGIEVRGAKHLDKSVSIYVRSHALWSMHDKGRAYRYVLADSNGVWGVLTTIDGRDLWRIQVIGVDETDASALDIAAIIRRIAGEDVDFTLDGITSWIRKMTVADRFIDNRVMIAGDSAHAHPPNGGLGMNTGIQDAWDLGWKLSAVLQGWGGPNLLDTYDIERRPAASRAAGESLVNYRRLTAAPHEPKLTEDSADGAAARQRLGARLVEENEKAWRSLGVHLGYQYDPSPIVIPDGGPRPEDDTIGYTPSARPGARAPHAWLGEDRSTLDLFGDGFALLNFGAGETEALQTAASKRGLPLKQAAIEDEGVHQLYGARLVLVRPDGHVAWRGDSAPRRAAECERIMDTVRGAGPRISARRAAAPGFDAP